MRVKPRGYKLLVLLLSFALFSAAACGGDDDDDGDAGGAPEQVDEGDVPEGGTITYASDQEPTGWNINTANDNTAALNYMTVLVYPSVFVIQPDFSVEPDPNVVESAEQTSDDPQTIEYVLNADAAWSDDTPVSADDFIFYWKMKNGKQDADLGEGDPESDATDPETIPDVAASTGYNQIESVEGSEDGKTVTVVFAEPYADWQGLFDNILPAHIIQDVTGWNASLDGENIPDWSGGPFKFDKYDPEQSVTLVPNEKYWGSTPKLDEIVVRFGIDAPAIPAALENNEIDLAYPQPQVDLLDELGNIPEVSTQINFGLSFEHIDFNLLNPLLAQKEVREAIALGLDREDLVARTVKQFDDRAEVLNNRIWLNNQPQYEAHGDEYAFDPDAAMQKLDDAGFTKGADGIYEKDGEKLSFRISTTGGNKLREDTQEVIQSQLEEIGIDITIDNLPGAEVFDKFFPESGNFADADYDIALFAWVGTPFPASSNSSLYSTGQGQNEMSYSNETVDELFVQAVGSTDPDEVVDLTNQIDEELWKDIPTIPLYAKPTLLPYRDSLINIVDNASTQGPLWNATVWGVEQ